MAEEAPLTSLRQGEKAVVSAVPDHGEYLRRLLVFGVLPGAEIEVVQTFPSYVLNVGNTMLALDRDMAENIQVRKY